MLDLSREEDFQLSCSMEPRSPSGVYDMTKDWGSEMHVIISHHAVGLPRKEIVTASGEGREVKLRIARLKDGLCEYGAGCL